MEGEETSDIALTSKHTCQESAKFDIIYTPKQQWSKIRIKKVDFLKFSKINEDVAIQVQAYLSNNEDLFLMSRLVIFEEIMKKIRKKRKEERCRKMKSLRTFQISMTISLHYKRHSKLNSAQSKVIIDIIKKTSRFFNC